MPIESRSHLRVAAFLLLLVALPALAEKPPAKDPKPKTKAQILASAKAPRPAVGSIFDTYLNSWLQTFPSLAAAFGDHSQDKNLEDLPPQRLLAWLRLNKALAGEVDKRLANPEIQGDERIDLHVLRRQITLEILTYDAMRSHQQDPTYWSDLLSQATIFQLVREDRPLAERLEAAASRADQIPRLARQAIANLAMGESYNVAPEKVDTALASLRRMADFYHQGFSHAAGPMPAGAKREQLTERLAKSGAVAAVAIEGTYPFLEKLKEQAQGDPRLGPLYYSLFRARTGLSESPRAVVARAQKALVGKRQEAAAHCRSIWPTFFAETPMPDEEKDLLQICFARVEESGAKTLTEFIEDYRQLTADAQAFVRRKGFFTLPPKLDIRVERSPAYLGGASVGGVFPPGPYTPDAPSILFVPAPPDDTPPEDLAAFFKDFNHYFNVMITPHETVPGHAAQMTVAAPLPSKLRNIFSNGPYMEGWGTFSERIMLDQGWGDGLARVAHLKKQLENIARTIVDISVHTEGWTKEQAVEFVQQEALQKEQFAGNMWYRTLQTPTQITTYWIGYQQIYDLYEEAQKRYGDKFVLKDFLDGMMELGPVPVHFYRKVVLPQPPPSPKPIESHPTEEPKPESPPTQDAGQG